jgi:hypothetical protein
VLYRKGFDSGKKILLKKQFRRKNKMSGNIIAKIKVTVEIEITEEDINIDKLEEKIYEASLSAGREIFPKSLSAIEEYLLKEKRDKKKEPIHIVKKGYLETLVGEIRYSYRRLKNKNSGKYYSILKKAMGIKGNITNGVKVRGVMYSSEVSYRKAAEHTGNQLSHSSIRNSALKMGEILKKKEEDYDGEEVRNNLFKGERKQCFVEADGIMIPMQGGKNKKSEVKLAICYSGREERYKEGKREEKKLREKVVYGDICKSEEFIEKASLFFNYFCNLMKVLYIVILGDGASWIKGFQSVYNWSAYQLDRFHLLRKLRSHFSRKKDEYEEIKKMIEGNRIEDLFSKIEGKITCLEDKILAYKTRSILEKGKEERESYKRRISHYKKRLKRARELLTYIEINREGINGIDKYKDVFKEEDLVVGSGGIESEVKNTIARRMKGQGKCWKTRGAKAMVKLLTSLANGWYTEKDYLDFFSTTYEEPVYQGRRKKERNRIIYKEKIEIFTRAEVLKGPIPCSAPSSSAIGALKKNLANYNELDIIYR